MTKLDKSVSFYDIFKSQKQPQILHQDELIMPFFTMNMVRDNFWQFKCWPDVVLWTMTCIIVSPVLTGNVPYISESCIEIKIKLNFYFHTSLWCHKRFYEGLKNLTIFFSSSRIGMGRVKREQRYSQAVWFQYLSIAIASDFICNWVKIMTVKD